MRGSSAYQPHESPRKWADRRKVSLTPESPAIIVPLMACAATDFGAPVAYVRRRGTGGYLLRYPHFDVETNGDFLFVFDKLFFGLPSGRYAIELWQGNEPNREDCSVGRVCAEFEAQVSGPCTINPRLIECIAANMPTIRKGDYPVPNPIFDAINDFSVTLTSVLESGSITLPLKTSDKAALCAMLLCRSVELKLCDGLREETVRYTGCVVGEPQFVRGVGEEGAFRFPKGAMLTFDWTEGNITAACEGC